MFEQLLQYGKSNDTSGVIWSLEGSNYLAFAMAPSGKVTTRAETSFANLASARSWLRDQGINTISLRQSGAYLEMIGQEPVNSDRH